MMIMVNCSCKWIDQPVRTFARSLFYMHYVLVCSLDAKRGGVGRYRSWGSKFWITLGRSHQTADTCLVHRELAA